MLCAVLSEREIRLYWTVLNCIELGTIQDEDRQQARVETLFHVHTFALQNSTSVVEWNKYALMRLWWAIPSLLTTARFKLIVDRTSAIIRDANDEEVHGWNHIYEALHGPSRVAV